VPVTRTWIALSVVTVALMLVGTGAMAVADDRDAGADEKQAWQIWTTLGISPDFANNRITVDVDDGIAVLEGTVDSEEEKVQAQLLAHVDGILGVNNRLRVRGAGK
jgi:BON domain